MNCVDRYFDIFGDFIVLIWEKDELGIEEYVLYRYIYKFVIGGFIGNFIGYIF